MDEPTAQAPAPPEEQVKIPDDLPVLPLKDIVTFPFMIVPLFITREKSIRAVDQALSQNRMILLCAQKDSKIDDPTVADIYQTGTVAIIMRMLKLPDQRLRILVQGLARARVDRWDETKPYLAAAITTLQETEVERALEIEALMRNVKEALERCVAMGKNISPEVMIVIANIDDPGRLADLAASNLDLRIEEAQEIIEFIDPVVRLKRVHEFLLRELELLDVQQRISTQAKDEIEKSQREYFLRQQMKAIQTELGEGGDFSEEVQQYREKADKAGLPDEAKAEVNRQIQRLEKLHPESAETATVRTYLDWMVGLPWAKVTEDTLDLKQAQAILDEDHYDLEKVKTRIIEYLAVLKLKKTMKGPLLCFVGPPGVGKTSLGKSIARALGRRFVRISLGGVHDEAEIRGHRRTYVGAMPGRIIQGINQAESNNPVFMLDEVDKIGADFRGDPSSALLEVLDPEQNFAFRDNYLQVPFDLSRVLFITTANLLDPIQPAFLDRMEVIRLSGYTEAEKMSIARKYLIPKQVEAHGLEQKDIRIPEDALRLVINQYTREAGLRNLEREIATICRKVARRKAEGARMPVTVTRAKVHESLGAEKILPEDLLKEDKVGVATGMAWTPSGGDILFVEAIAMKGKGNLMLTGQLGDVMKESAHAALSYLRAHARDLGLTEEFFEEHDFHVHIPEGALPKDGPSAGVTMATALVSVCTQRPIRRSLAMTGEITLRGRVLPVGGVKEKVLAAMRNKITTIILPKPNRRDLDDIPEELRKNVNFILVEEIDEVLHPALLEPRRKGISTRLRLAQPARKADARKK
ncbi:MAG: endopeptidase La [Acidobacteriota bacterium]